MIGVSRTFPCSVEHAWEVVTTVGLQRWLGVEPPIDPTPGAGYQAADGTTGEVRSYRPNDRIRLTWHPPHWSHDSTVQVALAPRGDKTMVRFHQERLADPEERAAMREHWRAAIEDLAPLLGSTSAT